MKKTL